MDKDDFIYILAGLIKLLGEGAKEIHYNDLVFELSKDSEMWKPHAIYRMTVMEIIEKCGFKVIGYDEESENAEIQ